MSENNLNFAISRTEGKKNCEIGKKIFLKYYLKHSKNPVDQRTYRFFTKDLFNAFAEAIIKENLELKLPNMGRIRVRARTLTFLDIHGNLRRCLKVNWKETKELWISLYPNMTPDEIKNIKNKPRIFHTNEHSFGEFYYHYWDKLTTSTKNLFFYEFVPTRWSKRNLAQIIKDPNRKIIYYG